MESGKLVRTVPVSPHEFPDLELPNLDHPDFVGETARLFEHERIPFPSYPYEWPPEMLYSAGALTLELAQGALEEGFGLKDATPYNVLFRGSQPVFVDLPSFERRGPLDTTWMAYAQFVRTFLLPLLANREFGLPIGSVLAGNRDGLEPETVYRWAGFGQRLRAPFPSLVTIPNWLGRRKPKDLAIYQRKPAASEEQAQFLVNGMLKHSGRQLKALRPPGGESAWTGYLDRKSVYTAEQLAQKEAFVAEALAFAKPGNVLDVGANEGHFSFLAAKYGASVVAIDSDPAVAGAIWRKASEAGFDILPLVIDFTRPSPAIGWRNQECASFLDRSKNRFDMVMMLAVIHHMLITERIPLEDLLALAAELTREYLLIEFVAPEDPMFQRIVRGRGGLYSHLTTSRFEAAAKARFELVKSKEMDGLHRCLYLFRKRPSAN